MKVRVLIDDGGKDGHQAKSWVTDPSSYEASLDAIASALPAGCRIVAVSVERDEVPLPA
ncbi:hypothetical protein [Nocardioides sp.]|uniref:hypothetical protein n=1 Tax=Nocardioides sp. TaxID=35761 RepID=UPI00272305DF|nr:hypothetical protein [Nocardioides sp.]MDO9457703.1 hypothetical protein [Nocardioides sp.]